MYFITIKRARMHTVKENFHSTRKALITTVTGSHGVGTGP